MTFGVVPDVDDMDETTSRKLQSIARQRIRKAKDDEKKRRQEERLNRRFQKTLKELSLKESREKRRLERLREEEMRLKKQQVREERSRRLQQELETKRIATEQKRKERKEKRRREEEIDGDTERFLNGLRGDSVEGAGEDGDADSEDARRDEEFELFMEGLRGGDEAEVVSKTKRAKASKNSTNKRTPGGIKTYGHRDKRPTRIPSNQCHIVQIKSTLTWTHKGMIAITVQIFQLFHHHTPPVLDSPKPFDNSLTSPLLVDLP
ncbi:hypothetical protein C369_07301 [Cryptococcus neoformans A5-35-17]|nr:hypothetical protein C369_07301 [Cryptococcus neoformans var. grubii A5-35-17]